MKKAPWIVTCFWSVYFLGAPPLWAEPTLEEAARFPVVSPLLPSFNMVNDTWASSSSTMPFDSYHHLDGYEVGNQKFVGLYFAPSRWTEAKLINGFTVQDQMGFHSMKIFREDVGGFGINADVRPEADRLTPGEGLFALRSIGSEYRSTDPLDTVSFFETTPNSRMARASSNRSPELTAATGTLKSWNPYLAVEVGPGERLIAFKTSDRKLALAYFYPGLSDGYHQAPVIFPDVSIRKSGEQSVVEVQIDLRGIRSFMGESRFLPPNQTELPLIALQIVWEKGRQNLSIWMSNKIASRQPERDLRCPALVLQQYRVLGLSR